MKLYVIFDMEGITGIVDHRRQCWPDGEYFEQGMRLATGDLNALAEAAVECGAREITVWAGHCDYPGGLDVERIHPACRVIYGANDGGPVGLDGTYDAVLLLGLHAMAGTENGVLAHSFMPHIREVWLNGLRIGEIGMLCITSGAAGVPVVFVSGDHAAVQEACSLVPDVAGVAVKRGMGGVAGLNTAPAVVIPPAETARMIRAGVKQALGSIGRIAPYRMEAPYAMKVVYADDNAAVGMAAGNPAIRHTAPCIIEMSSDTLDGLCF